MDRGFISLHRKILDNPIMMNAGLFQLFIYLILRANHKTNRFIFNDMEIIIKRGELIVGRKQIAKDLKIDESTIYKRIQTLIRLGTITQKSNNRFSIINIVKYNDFQNFKVKGNNKVTTKEQQSNTNNNDNNVNNDNKKDRGARSLIIPTLNEIIDYWKLKNYNGGSGEANKYFNYYESNGWRVGRSPMKNWKAAANNWQLRAKEYSNSNNNNKLEVNGKYRRCPGCNNYLTSDGLCYVPECSASQINQQIKNILEN